MERGKDPRCIRRRRPDERGVEPDRVVVVLLRCFGNHLVAHPTDRVLLRQRALRRMRQRVERRPVRVRERTLFVVDVHLVADHPLGRRGEPDVDGVATGNR